ncbi:hypothetical protein [Lapillicoccus sp.]|uniref:hypothetical protein n=1 Tax=Lapillicoccus sp. TaxID=1909287 RepID=UPI0025DB2CD5|nr:hypothetical protein [Lapillicoccus sp.]
MTAAGLVVDSVIHLYLASGYQEAAPGGFGEGNLFRTQAVAALIVAVLVLARGSRATYLASAVVAAAALAAVLLYRYLDLPPLGPLPSMYEPIWFPTKTATAVAEAVAVASSLVGLYWPRPQPTP